MPDAIASGEPDASAGEASNLVLRNVVLIFVGIVFVVGLVVSAHAINQGLGSDFLALGVLAVAAALAEIFKLTINADSPLAVSLTLALFLSAVVVSGPGGAVLVGLVAALAAGVARRPRPSIEKTLFNMGLFSIGAAATGFTYKALGGALGHGALGWKDALAGTAALGAYFAVTWPLLMAILHLTTHKPLRILYEEFRWLPVQIGISAMIGFTLGAAYLLFSWVGVAVYVGPLLAVRESMRQYTRRVGSQIDELRQAHFEADAANQKLTELNAALDITNEGLLKTLASVIDARDIYLYGHSVQSSKYAGDVARIMQLSPEQTRIAELGALLHDLGKIGVSEAILNKPARLTDAEYEEIKSHCEIGYQLLSNLPNFEEVAEIVYSHHEHFDGTGYPRGLKGDQIPIGARIVSVVEATEAMVSDRPYRRGMTPDEVLQELADGAGSQWDADVVRVFSAMLSKDRKHLSMRNSALEVVLTRTPVARLVKPTDDIALHGVTATFHGAPQPILILGQDFRVVAANPAAERTLGFVEAQLQDRSWFELTGSAEPQPGVAEGYFSSARVANLTHADGDPVRLEVTGSQLQTNSATYWVVLGTPVIAPISAGPPAAADELTNLAGLEALRLEADDAINRGAEPLTVAVMNVDGLRAINDTFGREVGDGALKVLSGVLRAQLREGDVAARVGADTLALLMRRATLTDAGRALQRVEDALPDAVDKAEVECVIEFCSGAAQWNGHETFVELMARARLWMEAEKRSRKPGPVVALPLTRQRRRGPGEPGGAAEGGLG